jgi:hypothetical protein
VRDRQKPFHQRQPAVEVLLDVGIIDLEVDRLLLDRMTRKNVVSRSSCSG